MDLVEVIDIEHTSGATTDLCEALVKDFGKTPIRCRGDVPMFVVNRCMRPYGEAAAWLVYYDEATIEEADSAMKYQKDIPMGPFELADYTEESRSVWRANWISSRILDHSATTLATVLCSTIL